MILRIVRHARTPRTNRLVRRIENRLVHFTNASIQRAAFVEVCFESNFDREHLGKRFVFAFARVDTCKSLRSGNHEVRISRIDAENASIHAFGTIEIAQHVLANLGDDHEDLALGRRRAACIRSSSEHLRHLLVFTEATTDFHEPFTNSRIVGF